LPHGPTVPDTIHGVITARIDRLPEETKRVLQAASVLGREVSLRLLNATWEGSGIPSALTVENHLSELKRMEFLYEQSWAAEPGYVFKHALTQEVAYESLLTARRQVLHAAAGQALERLYEERLEQVYDRLAYHYSKTNESTKAVEYLTRFARQAARKFAHAEAVTALQGALAHVERLPAEQRDAHLLDIVPRLARSLSSLGRLAEAIDLLLQQKERVERLQNPFVTSRYYLLLANTYTFLDDQEPTVQSAHRAMEEARQCGDQVTMGKASYVLAFASVWSGQFRQGLDYGREAVSFLERTEEQSWLGAAHWVLGWNHFLLGEFDLVLEVLARARAIAEANGDPRVESPVTRLIGLIHVLSGEWEAGIEACQRALQCAPDPFNTAESLGCLGLAYLEKGDAAQAVLLLEQSVRQVSHFKRYAVQGWFMATLGEAYLLTGQTERARDLVSQGLELAEATKYWAAVGWAQRSLGRIAQARGFSSEAESHLKEALQTFTSIHARYLVARTHLDFAALAHAQGNREAVRTHLKEAHELFTALRVPYYVERTEQLAREFLGDAHLPRVV
ncbi:MAG: tetratricopeptide repeat protein, partial [Candidatus Rokubacteria bacterium]|nr:tetratricopeptide repeat protein [Candidatus Rokubacteria bacterium]